MGRYTNQEAVPVGFYLEVLARYLVHIILSTLTALVVYLGRCSPDLPYCLYTSLSFAHYFTVLLALPVYACLMYFELFYWFY